MTYCQRDPRWAEQLIVPGKRLKSHGCLITETARELSMFTGKELLPNVWLHYCQTYGFIRPDGSLDWAAIPHFTKGKLKRWPVRLGARYIIAHVKFGVGHFVGYNSKTNEVVDPWDGQRKPSKAYFAKYPVMGWRYLR